MQVLPPCRADADTTRCRARFAPAWLRPTAPAPWPARLDHRSARSLLPPACMHAPSEAKVKVATPPPPRGAAADGEGEGGDGRWWYEGYGAVAGALEVEQGEEAQQVADVKALSGRVESHVH